MTSIKALRSGAFSQDSKRTSSKKNPVSSTKGTLKYPATIDSVGELLDLITKFSFESDVKAGIIGSTSKISAEGLGVLMSLTPAGVRKLNKAIVGVLPWFAKAIKKAYNYLPEDRDSVVLLEDVDDEKVVAVITDDLFRQALNELDVLGTLVATIVSTPSSRPRAAATAKRRFVDINRQFRTGFVDTFDNFGFGIKSFDGFLDEFVTHLRNDGKVSTVTLRSALGSFIKLSKYDALAAAIRGRGLSLTEAVNAIANRYNVVIKDKVSGVDADGNGKTKPVISVTIKKDSNNSYVVNNYDNLEQALQTVEGAPTAFGEALGAIKLSNEYSVRFEGRKKFVDRRSSENADTIEAIIAALNEDEIRERQASIAELSGSVYSDSKSNMERKISAIEASNRAFHERKLVALNKETDKFADSGITGGTTLGKVISIISDSDRSNDRGRAISSSEYATSEAADAYDIAVRLSEDIKTLEVNSGYTVEQLVAGLERLLEDGRKEFDKRQREAKRRAARGTGRGVARSTRKARS